MLGDRLYQIFERPVNNSPPDKTRGHSLTDCMCYLNLDAQTPASFGAAQVMLYNLGEGREHPPCILPRSQAQGESSYQTGGGQRDSAHFSAVSVQFWESVSTENWKYFSIVHPVSPCIAKNNKKLMLVQDTSWTNREKPFLIIYTFNTCARAERMGKPPSPARMKATSHVSLVHK